MSFRKRQLSAVVVKANKRRDGLRSIDENIDLGNGLTGTAYKAETDKVIGLTEQYNTQLSQLDGIRAELEKAEKNLAEWSKRILSGVGSKYGYDSTEYEKAGGTRRSARKRHSKSNDNDNAAK
jgi:hypothetical protein